MSHPVAPEQTFTRCLRRFRNGHLTSIHFTISNMDPHDTALTIHELLEGRDLASPVVFEPLSNAFMLVAKQLAESATFRYGPSLCFGRFRKTDPLARKALGQESTIWQDLETVWTHLPKQICVKEPSDPIRNLCICTSRFTRNLVAGAPDNQVKALYGP